MEDVRSTCTLVRKYRAFISYSHDDGEVAKWLHNALETWKLPSDIRALVRKQRGDLRRLFPVFIDHGELSSSPSLRQALKQALDNSDALIVLCSPTSATSNWVNEEVLHFKRTRRGEKIITVMVDSAPKRTNHASPSDEYFCPALRHPLGEDNELEVSQREEPLAIDMRERSGISRRDVLLKVIAGIEGAAVRSASVKLKVVPQDAVWVPGLKMWSGFMGVRFGGDGERSLGWCLRRGF
ncbi:toll/interleukin-1 receptor domain-containing protein [Pseudomonas sp. dw_612]|uniref:toll/interleukin-1 receptor domain-containing protein n=1 Tax=Pseudomonas sp. dw_612 TaxID=2720080 RepID=UPI001BD26C44|nr:toll/interleukin-1 receptor domain-containing protein [Pseudomonas sp. dw_612]